MPRSNFSQAGLAIGENNANMTYLYGISDFFSVMFEDTAKTNLLLEAGSEGASQVYSKFLQLTSTISLEDVQKTLGQTLKLVIIKSSDAVAGELDTYTLEGEIRSSRYIANRPLLPTTLFEENVDYRLELLADGTTRIRFAKDITSAGFSTRLLSDGVTKEYALWFVDTEIDEKWISTHYAGMIGVDPAASSDAFKNLIYGLYYVYIHGPTLEMLRKGLNLCLGVPLARETETVLEIRKYLETDQWIVATDANQYLLPYGLDPIVEEGDVMNVGDELAQWVEVKDYINDGEWWINLMIPSNIIPDVPEGQVNRYATKGSHFDYLMRQYLKKHTFLVNVKVQDFKNNQAFEQLSDIIKRAKPAYTQAVYIWTIPKLEETLTLEESFFVQRRDQFRCENITQAIEKFYRANNSDALKRGCPTFTRSNVPDWVSKICGTDEYINGNTIPFNGGISNGFTNYVSQYRDNTDPEKAWLKTILERSAESPIPKRSMIGFNRGMTQPGDCTGSASHPLYKQAEIPRDMKIIPLYLTTQLDIENKCTVTGARIPDMTEWVFDMFNPNKISEAINALAINEGLQEFTISPLITHFNTLMNRGNDVYYLSNIIPQLGWETQKPSSASDIKPTDYILGVRVVDNVIAVHWVTSNLSINLKPYFVVEENDQMVASFTSRPSRGVGPTSSPFYLIRGRGSLDYNNVRSAINESPINEDNGESVIHNEYSDLENSVPKTFTRGGETLVHRMEIK